MASLQFNFHENVRVLDIQTPFAPIPTFEGFNLPHVCLEVTGGKLFQVRNCTFKRLVADGSVILDHSSFKTIAVTGNVFCQNQSAADFVQTEGDVVIESSCQIRSILKASRVFIHTTTQVKITLPLLPSTSHLYTDCTWSKDVTPSCPFTKLIGVTIDRDKEDLARFLRHAQTIVTAEEAREKRAADK